MKFLKFFSAAIVFALLLNSCKKDVDFTDRLSYGSLQDSSGECLPKNVHGVFNNGTTLTSDNYIDVHVTIDSVGTYDIKTDTVNGFSFQGTGTLGYKGDNLVRLYGSGRPLSGGVSTFIVSYNGTFCSVEVPVGGSVVPPAAFTLDNASGVCSGAVVAGTYATGLSVNGDNTATLSVNVTTIGTYTISTPTVNGIKFSKSGVFTATGVQTITLVASGTPTASTANNYTVTAGASTCTFSVTAITIAGASFTLGGAGSTCTGASSAGTYTAGIALTASNTLSVQVNVTTPGTYTISSNTVNGISFNKTGIFAGTGTQTVVLTGTGTPTAAGAFNYTVSAGAGNCTFGITTVAGGGGPVVNTDFYFKGTINSKSINYTVNTPPNIIGSLVESINGGPIGARFYSEGFGISDFDLSDTNDIQVTIGKQFPGEATTAQLVAMFHLGTYPYEGTGVTEGADIYYADENGQTWTASGGSQTGSTFTITELVDNTSTDVLSVKIFTAKFTCKLYNTLTGASINLVNGEIRGGLVSQ